MIFFGIFVAKYLMKDIYNQRGISMAIEIGEVFTMVDDEGVEQEVEVMGSLDLENQYYIAVVYLDELDDAEKKEEDLDIFFLQVNENDELSIIENDEEFEKVSAAFEAALEDK
jgi:uncharacterized protein YrzB (UPF0473 family)